MKQCSHIFLALLIAIASAPSGQGVASVLKMTAFVHHFMHHALCHGEALGVVEYVKLHYSHGEHHEEEHREHEDLPFQHHPHQTVTIAPILLFFSESPVQLIGTVSHENQLAIAYKDCFISHHFSYIWKPPKALV
jgi:hypothetical protein